MLPNKFVIIWNGKPVGLDSASGGYPYKTDVPCQVKYWDSREEAQKYMDVFASNGYHWEIKEIQFRIV